MDRSFNESLAKLEKLSPDVLHRTSKRIRRELAGAEWKLGICLLAHKRQGTFRKLGYPTLSDYAERGLGMSSRKAAELLNVAKALEHLPILSEAFRRGDLDWCKIRALYGVATPETEQLWLDYALTHRTDQVVAKVTLSPTGWKRLRGARASQAGCPIATNEDLGEILYGKRLEDGCPEGDRAGRGRQGYGESEDCRTSPHDVATDSSAFEPVPADAVAHGHRPDCQLAQTPDPEQGDVLTQGLAGASVDGLNSGQEVASLQQSASTPAQGSNLSQAIASAHLVDSLLSGPKTIRLTVDFTPDQWMAYERAEGRVRAKLGKRVSRAVVLTRLAEAYLDAGTARSRAKHQIVIYTEPSTGRAWYNSDHGPLPVDPAILQKAIAEDKKPFMMAPGDLLAPLDGTLG